MNEIWELAKGIETEGQRFYRNLAKEAPFEEIAGVLHFLAGQEKDHFEIFCLMQDGIVPRKHEKKEARNIAKKAFQTIITNVNKTKMLSGMESALKSAVALEKKSIEYYTSILTKIKGNEFRAGVHAIIEEERDHIAILQSLKELKQPDFPNP